MPVKVDITYVIAVDNASGKSPSWNVTSDKLRAVDGINFVKLRPYDESLCKVVCQGHLDLPKKIRPSLAQCSGWKDPLKCRNDAVAESMESQDAGAEVSLFGDDAKPSRKRVRAPSRVNAAQLPSRRDHPEVMAFLIPGTNDRPPLLVSTLRPAHPCDDLSVSLDADSLEHIFLFMREKGIDIESLSSKRQYGGMDSEPGVWRNGSGSKIRKLRADIIDSDNEGCEHLNKYQRIKGGGGDQSALALDANSHEELARIEDGCGSRALEEQDGSTDSLVGK